MNIRISRTFLTRTILGCALLLSTLLVAAGDGSTATVKSVMTDFVIPASDTIWGASDLSTDEDWQRVAEAAQRLLEAGDLLAGGGSSAAEQAWASDPRWQAFNQEMMEAARQVLVVVGKRDEEALFNVGNDALYPPCVGCHELFMPK